MRIRLKENCPLVKRIERVFEALDEQKLEISWDPFRGFAVVDRLTPDGKTYHLVDLEDPTTGAPILQDLPPSCEYKVCRELDADEEREFRKKQVVPLPTPEEKTS